MKEADAFVGSLIFDYDDVLVVESLLFNVKGPRLISARSNSWHSTSRDFSMNKTDDEDSGPPAVKLSCPSLVVVKKTSEWILETVKVGPSLLKLCLVKKLVI
jgi:magnesium chelatase subunit H